MYVYGGSNATNRGKIYLTNDPGAGTNTEIVTSTNTWTAGVWYHIAVVLDGVAGKVYLNGMDDTDTNLTSETGSSLTDSGTSLSIGERVSDVPISYFNGVLDEVRVSDIHRSPESILTGYNNQNNPISFYSLGSEETGGVITAETSVTKYFDARKGAMALNFDTELYLGGMVHTGGGYDPPVAFSRSHQTELGWPHIIEDCETYDIPVSFNICGLEAVFGNTGINEIAEIDVIHTWHTPHWLTNTWYSDLPESGGNYKTVGNISGYPDKSYGLIYGGNMTERTMNSEVPFEISYHNFGHEALGSINETIMNSTIRLGVEFHKRIGSKLTADAPPWNSNPQSSKYPIFVQNGIFVFNRMQGAADPYEVIENLWIIPRTGSFSAGSNLNSQIDSHISNGQVLAIYSHPEDGFDSTSRPGFQNSLAYARTKVDSGELWATTLSEIGRYWEAKSDVSTITQVVGNKTLVKWKLDAPR